MTPSLARTGSLLAIAMLSAVLAVGCGGDANGDGGDSVAAKKCLGGVSLSRPEFIEAADAACRKARSKLEEKVSRFLTNQNREKPRPVRYANLAHFVVLPVIEGEFEAIRYLGVPPSEENRVDDMLNEGQYVIDRLVFEDRIASIDAVYREFAEVRRMFLAYGLSACVDGSSVTEGGT